MSKGTWFERHSVEVRQSPWSASPTANDDADADEGVAVPEARRSIPVLSLVPPPPPDTSEQELAAARAELADAEDRIAGLHGEIAAAQATGAEARQALEHLTRTMLADAEPELIKLAIAIAERIVGRELATSPELVVAWARDALAASSLGEGVVIAVSADVARDVDPSRWDELASRVVTDAALAPSTCELRDGKSTVTVGGGERLDLVIEQLAGVPASEAA